MPLPPIQDSDWEKISPPRTTNSQPLDEYQPPQRESFPQEYSSFQTYSLWLDDLYSWMRRTQIIGINPPPPDKPYQKYDPFRSSLFRGTEDYSDAPEEEPDQPSYEESMNFLLLQHRHILYNSDPSILSDYLQAVQNTMKSSNPSERQRFGKTLLIYWQDQFNQEQEEEYLLRRPENFIGKSVMQAYVASEWVRKNLRENGLSFLNQKGMLVGYDFPSSLSGQRSSEPGPNYVNDRYFELLEWLKDTLPKLQVSNHYQIENHLEGEVISQDKLAYFFDTYLFSEYTGEQPNFDDYDRREDETPEEFQERMLEDYTWESEIEAYPYSHIVTSLMEYHDVRQRYNQDPERFTDSALREKITTLTDPFTSTPYRLISKQYLPALLNISALSRRTVSNSGVIMNDAEVDFLQNPDAWNHYITDTYSWKRGAFEWTETFDGSGDETANAPPVLMIDYEDPDSPVFLNYRYRFSFQYSGAKLSPINYYHKIPNFWRILTRNQAQ